MHRDFASLLFYLILASQISTVWASLLRAGREVRGVDRSAAARHRVRHEHQGRLEGGGGAARSSLSPLSLLAAYYRLLRNFTSTGFESSPVSVAYNATVSVKTDQLLATHTVYMC